MQYRSWLDWLIKPIIDLIPLSKHPDGLVNRDASPFNACLPVATYWINKKIKK
jgi:hypothetical protein